MEMGIGRLGDPNLILKRKFRYTLKIDTACSGEIPIWFVKVASRPQLDIDEVELNFLNGVTWVPGKGRWQPITVTYIDAAHQALGPLYGWLATVYDFNAANPKFDLRQSEKEGWAGKGTLSLYDGCGIELERWTLESMWPQSVNFGDLDYSSSEECTIELTMRYSEVRYEQPNCGSRIQKCCKGCQVKKEEEEVSDYG